MYLLDTNVISEYLKNAQANAAARPLGLALLNPSIEHSSAIKKAHVDRGLCPLLQTRAIAPVTVAHSENT